MFHFYEPPDATFADDGEPRFVAEIPAGLTGERELMAAVGRALAFPWYYGNNFDAFWDCVRELDGVKERRVALVHRDFPALPEPARTTYVELLRDATAYWDNPSAQHRFEAWFPKACEAEVNARLDACPPPADFE